MPVDWIAGALPGKLLAGGKLDPPGRRNRTTAYTIDTFVWVMLGRNFRTNAPVRCIWADRLDEMKHGNSPDARASRIETRHL
jgi:hypothetical protein